MNSIIRNIVAVIVGLLIGHSANFMLIKLGYTMFPIEGIDPNNFKELVKVMPTLDFKHFIFPFLAHALGTLLGVLVATIIAVNHKLKFAYGMGGFFLIGGIWASMVIPAPTWFVLTDLILAYIPMAWLGAKLTIKKQEL